MPNTYFISFIRHNHYDNFTLAEFESLAAIFNCLSLVKSSIQFPFQNTSPTSGDLFAICQLPNDEIAIKIQKRAVLIRSIVSIWSIGDSIEHLKENIIPLEERLKYISNLHSFSYEFFSHGRKLHVENRQEIMDILKPTFKGDEPVDCNNPCEVLEVIEIPTIHNKYSYVLGRRIAVKSVKNGQCFYHDFQLPNRPVLGPTSMDVELGVLMNNLGRVIETTRVFDPFVGTGGLLICSSLFFTNRPVTGSDADLRVLKGDKVAKFNRNFNNFIENVAQVPDIFYNFKYYNLPIPEIFACDNSADCLNRPIHNKSASSLFDSIITDPPYGVRATCQRIGTPPDSVEITNVYDRSNYIPRRTNYSDSEVLNDLLGRGFKLLDKGGILCFLYPVKLMELARLNGVDNFKDFKIRIDPSIGEELLICRPVNRHDFLRKKECLLKILPIVENLSHFDIEHCVLQILANGLGRLCIVGIRK